MDDNGLSHERIFDLRSQTFAKIRRHTAAIDAIAEATEALDFALQLSIDCRSIDEQQSLVTASRRLAELPDCEAAR